MLEERLTDVIVCEPDNTVFVQKSPIEDFSTGTQLIVHESQEAVFFMNGQALDSFPPGRHTLETQNIPLLRGFLSALSRGPFSTSGKTRLDGRGEGHTADDRTPYHCEVYFINMTEQMAVKWGTDSKVTYEDPGYHFPLQIGASGEMTLKVADPRKLLINIVGTDTILTQAGLVDKFRVFLLARVKPYIARTMREQQISIFATDEHMGEVSEHLHAVLRPDFEEYGLDLVRFFVTNIVKPDGERNYERFKELRFRQYGDVADAEIRKQVGIIDQQTDAQRTVIQAGATAESRRLQGYTYSDERTFDVAQATAENEAVGQMSNLGIGLGVMQGVSSGLGGAVAGITNQAMGNGAIPAPAPSTPSAAPPPAQEPLAPPAGPAPDDDMAAFAKRIQKLKALRDAGLLSDDEFDEQRKTLLGSI